MMPDMDGIETTKRLRDMNYSGSIVALTANAVSGQADAFLSSGFDDFISKPIDIRQMNLVLNRLIRDKQPPEVIEAARGNIKEKPAPPPQPTSLVDARVMAAFARDAAKVLKTLEDIAAKNDYSDEKDLRLYMINVHGIKSSLANIGRSELSASALRLETASKEKDFEVLSAETPAFLSSLRALLEELG
jgi:CheY-like chemotaxis protein